MPQKTRISVLYAINSTYGVKGMAAYVEHAYNLGFEDTSLYAFMQDALVATTRSDLTVADLTQWVLTCGEYGVKAWPY